MTPIRLQMHNFLSYREPKALDFTTFNLAVLSGNNGVGKSSILEAITWAVWGKTRASSDDELIFQGQNSTWVEFIFEHEKNLYRILRKRELKTKTGQTLLEFQTKSSKKTLLDEAGWQSISEATIKTTQEKIIRILKTPYEIFVNSSYLRQGHADEFTIKNPAERKEILSEVLGLNYYEELSSKAREKVRKSEEQFKVIAFNVEDLQIQIANKNETEKNLKEKLSLAADLQMKKVILKKEIANLDEKRKLYEVLTEKIANLKTKWHETRQLLDAKFLDIKSYQDEIAQINLTLKNKDKILREVAEFSKLERENQILEQKAVQYQKLIENLRVFEHIKHTFQSNVSRINKISNCPTCLRPMNQGEQEKIVTRLKKEYQKNEEPKLKEILEKINSLKYVPSFHQKVKGRLSLRDTIDEKRRMIEAADINLTNAQKNLKKNQEETKRAQRELTNIAVEGKTLNIKKEKLAEANAAFEVKNVLLEQIDTNMMQLQTQIGQIKAELLQIEKVNTELKNKEKELKSLQTEKEKFAELAIAFGKKGIQAMIIETSISSIEEEANVLLGKITDERMQLRFITQKEKKSNNEELIETLDIQISDEYGSRAYEMFSGGEAFRINFAIRIALSKLLASRSGTHLKFLAIDEGFGMLDTAGRDDLVAAINSISPDFEKILVITHLQELKDLFPTKIEVTKDENGSKIEITG